MTRKWVTGRPGLAPSTFLMGLYLVHAHAACNLHSGRAMGAVTGPGSRGQWSWAGNLRDPRQLKLHSETV